MIAIVGQRIASLIMMPVVTRYVTPTHYGVLDLLEQIGVVTSIVLGMNLSAALGYFYFEPGSDKSRVVGTAITSAVVMGVVGALVGLTVGMPLGRSILHSHDYDLFLRIVFLSLPLSFLLEVGMSWLRTEDRMSLFAAASLLRVGIIVPTTLAFVVLLQMRIGGVLGANVIAIGLVAATVAGIAIYHHGLKLDLSLCKRILRYSVPLAISGIALFIIHFGDRFILPYYRGMDQIGLYAVAYKFGLLISLVHLSFHSYWSAQLFQIVQRHDAQPIFGRIFTYMMVALSFCGLGLLVASRPAIHLLAAPAYFGATTLIPIILAAYYIRAIGDFFRALFLTQGKPSFDAACNWVGSIVCLGGYFLLIPRFGVMGAAVATLLSFVVVGIVSVYGAYRVWPYRLELGRLGKLALVTFSLAAVHFFLPESSFSVQVVQGVLLLGAFVAALAAWGFLHAQEWSLLRSTVSRLTTRVFAR